MQRLFVLQDVDEVGVPSSSDRGLVDTLQLFVGLFTLLEQVRRRALGLLFTSWISGL